MKIKILFILMSLGLVSKAQHADISVYPNVNNVIISFERLAGPLGFYGGAHYRMGVYSYNRYAVRPVHTRLSRLGINAGFKKSGIVLGIGTAIDMTGPDPKFYPNINVRLHPIMLLSKEQQKIDVSVSVDVANYIVCGFGIVLPLELVYW